MWGHSPWSLHYFCSCFTRKGSWTRNSLPRATAPSSIRRALRNDFRAQRTNSVRRKCTHQLLDGRRFGWNQFPTLKGSSWSPKTSKMFEFVLELLIFLLAVRIWHPSPFEGPPPPGLGLAYPNFPMVWGLSYEIKKKIGSLNTVFKFSIFNPSCLPIFHLHGLKCIHWPFSDSFNKWPGDPFLLSKKGSSGHLLKLSPKWKIANPVIQPFHAHPVPEVCKLFTKKAKMPDRQQLIDGSPDMWADARRCEGDPC